jgi:hypothetical protein
MKLHNSILFLKNYVKILKSTSEINVSSLYFETKHMEQK